jgi:hypothetical protein
VKPHVSSITYTSERDAGSVLIYTFVFPTEDPAIALRRLLEGRGVGHKISFADPQAPGDRSLEARRIDRGFETRHSRHGSSGTWRNASIDEALQWLLPGARWTKNHPSARGALHCPKADAVTSDTNAIPAPGHRYRVKQNFKSGPSMFIAGEILVFERSTFSPYDNCFVYVFQGESGAETKEWWLSESQSKESWRQYFEVVEGD